MSESPEHTTPAPTAAQSGRMVAALAGVAAAAGLLIVLAYQATLPVIEAKKAAALRRAVFDVIPGASRVVTYRLGPEGRAMPLENEDARGPRVYAGYGEGGQLAGVAVEAQGQGYQGAIKVIYGYDPEQEVIVGMKVLESKETPGLGDKIGNDPDFLANFEALDVRLDEAGQAPLHDIEVVKPGARAEPWQIHGITGATISSEAVGDLLDRSAHERIPLVVRNLERFREGP